MTKPKTLEQFRGDKERAETQLAQELHKLERLENRLSHAHIGVISAPMCAFYHHSLGGFFHCFHPTLPAFFGFWVKSGSEAVISVEDWRAATLRHSPHYLSSYHKWRKRQRFVGIFFPHRVRLVLADRAEALAANIVVGRIGVEPAV